MKHRFKIFWGVFLLFAGLTAGGLSGEDLASGTTIILGRPTDRSITASLLSDGALDVFLEYGLASGSYPFQTAPSSLPAGQPVDVELSGLQPDTKYFYRLRYRSATDTGFLADTEHFFRTQRAPGKTFTFDIQADSHPERTKTMFDPELYARTLQLVAADQPDFYITLGDDFGVDTLKDLDAGTVGQIYATQRRYLGAIGRSAPIFLVNGNHEQAAAYLLDGTPDNVAVWAQNARNRYFPEPAPDSFYSGDEKPVDFIGLLRDYYAWTWGDALFMVIDPYWHSPVAVDSVLGGGQKNTDKWAVTLGADQYQWFRNTLEQSRAKYKFVFAHHVNGGGRGGVELAKSHEWGGYNDKGVWEFAAKRPAWELPIHPLMAKNNVTIFFQGHDHLFAKQELDGVVYQECPIPADYTYTAFNEDAYTSGIKLPNAGHLRVTVSETEVKVEYIRSFLPGDETAGHRNGELAYAYTNNQRMKQGKIKRSP